MSTEPRLHAASIVFDVHDLARAAAFWSESLGYEIQKRSPSFWRLRSPRHAHAVMIDLQPAVDEKKDINRVHLDLYTDDMDREVARLMALGATRPEWPWAEPDDNFVVLCDPDGNEFCVVEVTPDRLP